MTKEELLQRKHDAEQLLDHYLIKEYFCDIENVCYDGIINSEGADSRQRERFYLLARAVKLLKSSFTDTINQGSFQKEVVIKQVRSIDG